MKLARPKKTHKNRIYKPPQLAALMVMENQPDYVVPCPVCEKRALDVSELPERLIKLRFKCPHCRNIVVTPLMSDNRSDCLSNPASYTL